MMLFSFLSTLFSQSIKVAYLHITRYHCSTFAIPGPNLTTDTQSHCTSGSHSIEVFAAQVSLKLPVRNVLGLVWLYLSRWTKIRVVINISMSTISEGTAIIIIGDLKATPNQFFHVSAKRLLISWQSYEWQRLHFFLSFGTIYGLMLPWKKELTNRHCSISSSALRGLSAQNSFW